uniref:Uncharacterized protein n=1 Tax=Plectus sambesii TaxID=2011161 RepID=A0A914WKS2_9BILA
MVASYCLCIALAAAYLLTVCTTATVDVEKNVTGNTINFNVEPSRKYVANVVTWNNHGSSIPTFNTTFDSPAVGNTDTSPGKPSPPHSVRVVWNNGSSLNVTWSFSHLTLDGRIITKPTYKVQYGPVQPADSTTSRIRSEVLKTEDMWARLEGLTENTVYDIYASVIDSGSGLESAASEIISVFMTPDSLGMPEPTLTIEPPLQPGTVYAYGLRVFITCKANGPDAKNVNVEIVGGENVANSDPGSDRATMLLTVSAKLVNEAVICFVSKANGHQNRAETRIRVQFGPEVHVEKPTIHAFKDMSLQLVCLVRGYPQPTVTWSFRPPGDSNAQQPVTDPVMRRLESDLGFESVLLIANTTGRAGTYFCTASTSAGAQREMSIEVQLNMALPLTPDFVMNCCLEHKVLEQCRSPCNYTLDPNLVKPTNGCEQETPKLLYCAKDGIDHTDCCAANGVTKECLPFCDRSIDDSDQPKQHLDISQCSKFAQTVLECFMKSHAVLPSPPGTVHADTMGPTALKVHWTKPKNSEEIDQYAVYYKPLNDANAKYEMVLTKTDSVVLEGLKSGESYALAVISLNMYGFSQFSILREAVVDPNFSNSSYFGSMVVGMLIGTLVGILVYIMKMVKRRQAAIRAKRLNGKTATGYLTNVYEKLKLKKLGRTFLTPSVQCISVLKIDIVNMVDIPDAVGQVPQVCLVATDAISSGRRAGHLPINQPVTGSRAHSGWTCYLCRVYRPPDGP